MLYTYLIKSFSMAMPLLVVLACKAPGRNNASQQQPMVQQYNEMLNKKPVRMDEVFTLWDAALILGEPAVLNDSSTSRKAGVVVFQSSYMAKDLDKVTQKTGNVYFFIEKYEDEADAKKTYTSIKQANEGHEGIKTLNDVGDEAYFHTDNENFYFIMVRRGKYGFRIKVNKITSLTSLEAFNKIASKIDGLLK